MNSDAIVLGMPREKGNSTVINSYPVDSVQPMGVFGYITSAGKLAACTSSLTPARGIIGQPNADGKTQALIEKGIQVGAKFVYSLTIAVGETVYMKDSDATLTNLSSSATAKNAKFSSVKAPAYDPVSKTVLGATSYKAAYIDFPGGIN